MKKYYADGSVTLYHGDCRELFTLLPPENYIVITDPPYGETALEWDKWVDGWPTQASRVARSMWCFGSFRMFMEHWTEFNAWKLSQDIIWEKHNGSSSMDDRFRRVHESALHLYRIDTAWADIYHKCPVTMDATARKINASGHPKHWNKRANVPFEVEEGGPKLARSVQYVRSCHGHAIHPTQKPEGIIRPLMEYAAGPGSIVVDPFCGSGTTLVVAKAMGIPAIGCELNEADCEGAANRLRQEQLPLNHHA